MVNLIRGRSGECWKEGAIQVTADGFICYFRLQSHIKSHQQVSNDFITLPILEIKIKHINPLPHGDANRHTILKEKINN